MNYTLHILSIAAIGVDAFDLPREQNAIIVCAATDKELTDYALPQNTLRLDFPDVTDRRWAGAFHRAHAEQILCFVRGLSAQVSDIYVCCEQGYSRSPAIAAALLRMTGRSDRDVWRNPYYQPNTLVYQRLCRACGLFTPRLAVWHKTRVNRRAYRRAQRGTAHPYERWQLLQ